MYLKMIVMLPSDNKLRGNKYGANNNDILLT